MYFMGSRALMSLASGAGLLGPTHSVVVHGFSSFLFVPFLFDVLSARRAITQSSLLTEIRYHLWVALECNSIRAFCVV
jgi:hypothetical protein